MDFWTNPIQTGPHEFPWELCEEMCIDRLQDLVSFPDCTASDIGTWNRPWAPACQLPDPLFSPLHAALCLEASFLGVDCACHTVARSWQKALEESVWQGMDRDLGRNPSSGPDTFWPGRVWFLFFLPCRWVNNKSEVFISEQGTPRLRCPFPGKGCPSVVRKGNNIWSESPLWNCFRCCTGFFKKI